MVIEGKLLVTLIVLALCALFLSLSATARWNVILFRISMSLCGGAVGVFLTYIWRLP